MSYEITSHVNATQEMHKLDARDCDTKSNGSTASRPEYKCTELCDNDSGLVPVAHGTQMGRAKTAKTLGKALPESEKGM